MNANKTPADERERAFTELVEQYQTQLRRVCLAIQRDGEGASDAVQETFLKAYQAMDSLRGDGGEKAWLMRIAINTCSDMRRSTWFCRVDRRVTPEDLPLASDAPRRGERRTVARHSAATVKAPGGGDPPLLEEQKAGN